MKKHYFCLKRDKLCHVTCLVHYLFNCKSPSIIPARITKGPTIEFQQRCYWYSLQAIWMSDSFVIRVCIFCFTSYKYCDLFKYLEEQQTPMCIVELEFLLYSHFEVGGTLSIYQKNLYFTTLYKKLFKIKTWQNLENMLG